MLLVELRDELDAYLAGRAGVGPRSLDEVVAFNEEHADRELQHFGQELLEQALTLPARDSEPTAARDAGVSIGPWRDASRPRYRLTAAPT